MKRMSFVVGLAAVAVSTTLSAATVSVSSEDVFADAYIWMRGMAVDKNGNHVLDVGEITNSLHTVALTTGSFGAAGHKPVISNEFVRLPGRGVGRQMQTLYFPQDVVWTNEAQTLGTVTPCSVTCGTPLTDFDSHYTWIVRFRPDFSEPLLDTQWLLGFGYGNSRGMMFGLAGTSTEWRALRVYTTNGSWDLGESFVISNGCGWVDFAVTVDGQEVTAYLVKDGLTMPDGNTDIGLLKRVSRTYADTVNLVPYSGGYLRFGTESPQNGTYKMPAPSSGNNHYKCFRGSIQQFACWKRTLSEQEILAALGWPRAETWRVGVENDATTELSADTAPEGGFDVDGVLWPVPNGGLTNGVSVTFKFPIEAGYDDGRAQIFRWKATSDSAEGRLGVAVNGKPLGNRSIKAGATQRWFVPAAALTVGTNTLTVTRIDSGTGVVTLDAAALGGGWQVGRRDDDWSDFGHEGLVYDEYHVVDGNMRHVPRAMLYTGDGNHMSWHAVMPQSLAGEYDWILHFRTGPEGGGTGTRLCIDLNGERLATKDAPGTKTDHPFAIPRELLKAGENVFSFLNDTQSGTDSISIDSVWLEPVAPESAAPEFTSSASATEGVQNGNIEFTFSDLLSAGYPAPTYTITAAVSTGEYDFDGDTGYLYFRPANAGTFTFTCVASNEYGAATNTLIVTVTGDNTPFEQWLADHDASGHTPDQVAPNGHTYWDNYIADIDPGDMFLTIKLDPASGTLTIPAASPNRIYTLIWTTDLSTDKDKWKEVSLGSGDPDAKIPIPDTTAKSFFARVRVELPSESKDRSLLERKGRSLLTQVRQAEQIGGE